jgi:hypothetical protein
MSETPSNRKLMQQIKRDNPELYAQIKAENKGGFRRDLRALGVLAYAVLVVISAAGGLRNFCTLGQKETKQG